MKIECCITEVRDGGDCLGIKAQGKHPASAEWQPFLTFDFQMPLSATTQRALHVGRKIIITVKPS